MSDLEDFMVDEEEDYGLEYSEDSNSEPDVDLENQYYNSKALKEEDPKAALSSFQRVLDLENNEKGEWGFKALKQMIKINFKLNNYQEMMTRYKQLLTYIKMAVTRNHSEKSINSILDYISTSKNMTLLQDFYETTLDALKDAKNDRLWFKTNTKLGKLYYDRGDFQRLAKILKQLHQSCQTDDGEDDLKKGTQLLEIYALEIQMYTAQKNNKKLKGLYEQSLHIKSAIPHPLIMGVIRECGGKMHLREGEFEKAHTDFFEAFKNYDESGSPRRTTCLKYLVLANMLMKSGINPFDSQEAKPYKNDPEILAMTNLVSAYQNNDINEFEKILKQNRSNIMDDPFIREHIEDLLRNIRTQVLIKLIKPYTRIHIPFISKELNIDASEVEALLVSCILDNTVRGKIDQVNQVLELKHTASAGCARYSALDKWTTQLNALHILENGPEGNHRTDELQRKLEILSGITSVASISLCQVQYATFPLHKAHKFRRFQTVCYLPADSLRSASSSTVLDPAKKICEIKIFPFCWKKAVRETIPVKASVSEIFPAQFNLISLEMTRLLRGRRLGASGLVSSGHFFCSRFVERSN
ncbi:unnamed protein product [Allacma fusca]|uniref:COP9 signalosome complex subunit 2 n=1 Tax=Allacma fusca TaxID=39272 RepID=A0A8J2K256_9HEXA|nr:unnamed protein product [Allacma fusca]